MAGGVPEVVWVKYCLNANKLTNWLCKLLHLSYRYDGAYRWERAWHGQSQNHNFWVVERLGEMVVLWLSSCLTNHTSGTPSLSLQNRVMLKFKNKCHHGSAQLCCWPITMWTESPMNHHPTSIVPACWCPLGGAHWTVTNEPPPDKHCACLLVATWWCPSVTICYLKLS